MLNMARTRATKAKAPEEYTAAEKEVKRSVYKDKRDNIESLAQHAADAAGQGNLRELYVVAKKLQGKFQH